MLQLRLDISKVDDTTPGAFCSVTIREVFTFRLIKADIEHIFKLSRRDWQSLPAQQSWKMKDGKTKVVFFAGHVLERVREKHGEPGVCRSMSTFWPSQLRLDIQKLKLLEAYNFDLATWAMEETLSTLRGATEIDNMRIERAETRAVYVMPPPAPVKAKKLPRVEREALQRYRDFSRMPSVATWLPSAAKMPPLPRQVSKPRTSAPVNDAPALSSFSRMPSVATWFVAKPLPKAAKAIVLSPMHAPSLSFSDAVMVESFDSLALPSGSIDAIDAMVICAEASLS